MDDANLELSHLIRFFGLRIFCVNNNNNNKIGQKDDVIVVQVLIGRLCNHLAYLFMSSIRNFFSFLDGSRIAILYQIKQVDIIGIFLWVVTRSEKKKLLQQGNVCIYAQRIIFFLLFFDCVFEHWFATGVAASYQFNRRERLLNAHFNMMIVNVCVGTKSMYLRLTEVGRYWVGQFFV